jgi:serine protease Do
MSETIWRWRKQLQQPASHNSGGPLLDLSGNVVGVVSARINELAVAEATGSLPQNINFAIKSTIIRSFLEAHQITYETAVLWRKFLKDLVGRGERSKLVGLYFLSLPFIFIDRF